MSPDLHLGVCHRFGTGPACVQASHMGWLPWTRDEVEPPPRTGARAISPVRRLQQQRMEEAESQWRLEKEHKDKEQWQQDAPKREAEERRRQIKENRELLMEQKRAWLEKQARLKQEAKEQEARKQRCLTKIYETLLQYLEPDYTPRHKVREVVEQAWYGAQERLERRKYDMWFEELFEDLSKDMDTELVTLHDVSSNILWQASDEAYRRQRERMSEKWR